MDREHHRDAPRVEPDAVAWLSVDVIFSCGNAGAVDLHRRLLAAADAHLLDPAGIGMHYRIGAKKVGRPRVGRLNGCRGSDRATRRGDDEAVAARLPFTSARPSPLSETP